MNAKPFVLVLALAGLAIAAWFAFSGSGDPVTGPTSPTAQQANDPGDPGRADLAKLDGGGTAPGSGGGAAEAAAGERREASIAAPANVEDKVTIRGRLVGSDGKAMPDVDLLRSEWANPDGVDWFRPTRERAEGHELRTDAAGRFTFALRRDWSSRLALPSSELVFGDQPPTAHGHKGNSDLGDCLVERAGVVAGIVKDEASRPVAGVIVSALGGSGFAISSSAPTGDDGKFRVGKLKPGTWQVRTASAQYVPSTQELAVQAGARIDDIVLIVAVGKAIAGQVVDDLGRPVPDMRVGAKRTEARGAIEVERFTNDEADKTDANGYFTLAGLVGQTATVRAVGPGHSSAIATEVKVGTGNLILQVDRLAIVEGTLRGSDGGPIADSSVRAVAASTDEGPGAHGFEGMLNNRVPTAQTAADGSFRIEGVRPGTVTVAATGEHHRPAKQAGIQVAPAQVIKGVQLIAERGAVVNVTVTDVDGKGIADAKVFAQKPPQNIGSGRMHARSRRIEDNEDGVHMFDGDDDLGTAKTDAEGRAVIAGLPVGSVVLHAEHGDYAAAKPVTLPLLPNSNIETSLTLRTPGYAELHVIGVDGEPAKQELYRVRGPLRASDSGTKQGATDAEGKAVVGPLAAGNYIAELRRGAKATHVGGATILLGDDLGASIGGSEQRFRVTAGETTIVKVRRPQLTRVFGTVTGVSGPIAGCTVEIETTASGGPPVPGLGGGQSVGTEADGTFAIEGVEPGSYVLRYGKPEQIVKAEMRIDVPPELAELQRDLELRTGKVRVQAWSTTDGTPLANAEVKISRARKPDASQPERRETRVMMISISGDGDASDDSTMMTIGAQNAKTGADGWAEIEDVPVGEYDVRVTHRKHVPGEKKAVAVAEMQTAEAGRIEMGQAGRIRGKVVDSNGDAVRMGLVFHRPLDGPTAGEEGQPTPAMGGSFTISALPTGRYVLRGQAINMGGGGPAASSPEVEVEVKAGETATAELRLPEK